MFAPHARMSFASRNPRWLCRTSCRRPGSMPARPPRNKSCGRAGSRPGDERSGDPSSRSRARQWCRRNYRENRLGAVPIADLAEPRGDCVERFVPAHALKGFVLAPALEWRLRHPGFAPHRVQDAVRRVDAVEILCDFAAQKAPRDRLRWVALDLDRAAFLVHRHQHRARVRAVMRADRMNDAEGRGSGHGVIVS